MYNVNFGTGAGNYTSNEVLEVLMENILKEVTYTGESVKIEDEEGNQVARLPWYGCKAESDDVVTVDFEDFGFYGEWILD